MHVPFVILAALLLLCGAAHARDLSRLDDVAAGSPFSAIGRVNQGTGGYCTGVLIGRETAVTAAHCLYNKRTGHWINPGSIHFLLGYDRGSYGFHTTVKEYRTGDFDPKRVGETLGNDWALLRLAQPAPDQYASLEAVRGPYTADRRFQVVGFASPRRYVLSASPGCSAAELNGLLLSQCPSAGGMSGAPLIDKASGALVGIQIAILSRNEGDATLVALPALSWASSRFP